MLREGTCFQCSPAIFIGGFFFPAAVSFHGPPPKPLCSSLWPTSGAPLKIGLNSATELR